MRGWLEGSGAVPGDPAAFLRQGHLELVVRAWGDVPLGPRLETAAKWLVLTWIADDRFDDSWITRPPAEVRRTTRALARALGPSPAPVPPDREDAALVRALSGLWTETAELTGPVWRARYSRHYRAYLDASLGYLEHRAVRGTVPTVPEYLDGRDQDGAVLCAAGWVELAHGLELGDEVWAHPRMADVLARFSHVVCWVNDLYSAPAEGLAGNGKNLLSALISHEGLDGTTASARVRALYEAELTTFVFLADGIARSPSWPPPVRHFARGLIRFTEALVHWTATARRYRTHEGAR
ncbi:terpene synthase family protein [Streptomyces sp. NPDC094049]|uniref:terpene synthase family protein n=1 Tax=Streptomyces sp. NPDC094049 TaxID=3154987 RepID=UPI003332BDF1